MIVLREGILNETIVTRYLFGELVGLDADEKKMASRN